MQPIDKIGALSFYNADNNETLRNMWAKRLGNLVIMKYKETK